MSSGQAATTLALLNVAESGDHVVASAALYGGTFNLLKYTLPKMGIEVTFVEDVNNPEAWQSQVRENTKAFFGETIANPKSVVLDIEAVAQVAHDNGVPLIVDNTIATCMSSALEHGADVVVHSATKYLSGRHCHRGSSSTAARLTRPGPGEVLNQHPERATLAALRTDLGAGSALGANLAYISGLRPAAPRHRHRGLTVQRLPRRPGPETLSLRIGGTSRTPTRSPPSSAVTTRSSR